MFYSAEYDQYVREGVAFDLGGVQYPANWLNLSTPEEKLEAGLVEVVATNAPANQQFYWVSETLNGAELTYTNTPMDLDTLKATWTNNINSQAYSYLFPSDWMVIKATETSTPIDPAWNSYRENVRLTADTTKQSIALCTTVPELETLVLNVQWPHDPNWVDPTAGA
jgi:hypothetical protein